MSRVTAPTEGEIDIYGRIASMLEVGTGFNPEMTGRENVYLNGAILGMTKAEIDAKMEEIIEFSEVRDFIDTPVKRYSSGMYVKLAFSVAAHLDSEIMIMDEVLAVGDMRFQKKCLDKMRSAAKDDGRTVLYVSHNMATIRQLCDRCIVLNKGKVIFQGDVESAISVYMGTSLQHTQEREFSLDDHQDWCARKFIVKKCTIKNDINLLTCGDKIKFNIQFETTENLENLRARLVLLDNKFSIIGMSISNNQFSVEKDKQGTLSFEFDTASIAPGDYTTHFSVFWLNEYGGHEYVCVINYFMSFTLLDNPSIHQGMQWNLRSWGYTSYPDLQIEVK